MKSRDRQRPEIERLLGEPRVIARLPPAAIETLSDRFDAVDLACDLRSLALRFLRTPEIDGAARRLAWHHLLMAVTNFKASTANARLGRWDPAERRYSPYLDEVEPLTVDEFYVPTPTDTEPPVKIELADPQSLGEVLAGRGFAIPKTSTVLAAIWPDDHLILDRWDLGVAIGLQGADQSGTPTGCFSITELDQLWHQAIKIRGSSWANYEWLRKTATLTAQKHGLRLVNVERALLILGRLAKKERGWSAWSERLEQLIQQPAAGELPPWEPDTG